MPLCFIIGCKNGPKKLFVGPTDVIAEIPPKKVSFFSPPKDETLRDLWANNIPINGMQLKISSRVCDEHFLDHDIIKFAETVVDGKIHRLPWERWKLKSGAYPQIFPLSPVSSIVEKRKPPLARIPLGNIINYKGNCPSKMKCEKTKAIVKVVTKTLEQPIQAQSIQAESPVTVYPKVEVVAEPELESDFKAIEAAVEDKESTFLPCEIDNIKLPSATWRKGSITNGCLNYFNIEEKEKSVAIQKILSVDFTNRTFSQTVINRELTEIGEKRNNFTSLQQVEEVLTNLHNVRICSGIVNDEEKHRYAKNGLIRNGELVDGIWRSTRCSLLISDNGALKTCRFCKLLGKAMTMQFKRHKAV